MPNVRYEIASWPQEREVVAEILIGDEYVGWIAKRESSFELTMYKRTTDLIVDLDSLLPVLTEAKARLA